jgi:cytochrome c-type biogenesis protein CcmF
MTSTLGQGLVLIGLLACALGVPVGFYAGAARSRPALEWTRRMLLVYAVVMAAAVGVMEWALLHHDFSVSYVAHVGSLATPTHITIVSLWSSLEGSILFWGFVLGLFGAGVALLQRRGHEDYLGYTLATILVVGAFFSFLIAGPANPFRATPLPIPVDGPGPNPLLQNHVLMIIHPPMLYMGYVGMTVPFAMAVAALLRGHLGATWLRPLRAWLLVPTGFLTVGVMLGGWWSYEVLGWGGYWAWDPVENASFLPWLTAIAAVHSALVLERRGTLRAWTVILIQVTFLLTILGTFLTRSGVVNSVHSFTQSPIGPLFLGFLGFCLLSVVVLLAWRVDRLASAPGGAPVASRETAFLVNNLLLVAFMFTVLVGTLFPIVAEAVKGVKVSVGEPYFNRMAVPICFALLALMGIGPALPWGRAGDRELRRALLWPLPAAAAGLGVAWLAGSHNGSVLWAAALAGYALWVTADRGLRPARARRRAGDSLGAGLRGSLRIVGSYIVHFGVIVTFLAIAISANYQHSVEATLKPGGRLDVGDFSLTFDSLALAQEPHLTSQRATVQVSENGASRGTLVPALNFYPTMREPIGTPAVRSTIARDLYLTVMNVGNDGSIGLRAIVTPAVSWIWLGVMVMALGTGLCLAGAGGLRGSPA